MPKPTLLPFAALLLLAALPAPSQAQAACTLPGGFDLFETNPAETRIGLEGFPLMHFQGVPVGSYDFGSGAVTLTTTDTIVKRSAVTAAAPVATVDVVVLQMQGVEDPTLFVTAQAQRPLNALDPPAGPPNPGTLRFDFDADCLSGTFDSVINVNFDVRSGSLDGPIVAGGNLVLTTFGTPWDGDANGGNDCMNHPEAGDPVGFVRLVQHGICGPSDIITGVNDCCFYPGSPDPSDGGLGLPGRGGFVQTLAGANAASALVAFGLLGVTLAAMRRHARR